MMWKVFRRLKSSSETRVTAEKAVVGGVPLIRPKAVGRSDGWELGLKERGQHGEPSRLLLLLKSMFPSHPVVERPG